MNAVINVIIIKTKTNLLRNSLVIRGKSDGSMMLTTFPSIYSEASLKISDSFIFTYIYYLQRETDDITGYEILTHHLYIERQIKLISVS